LAEPSSGEVTAFQPPRPLLIASTEPNCRATVNGSEYDVESVPTRPIRSVTAASAERMAIGSNRLRKCGIDTSLM